MGFIIFLLILLLLVALLFCATVLYCFLRIFYSRDGFFSRKKADPYLPPGKVYLPHREKMKKWINAAQSISHTNVEIKSRDGLTLRGNYYEYKPGAPIELMFHGYRGNAKRDLSAGVIRAFAIGHSVLIVDNRGCGQSDGHISTFGVFESQDCLDWIDYIIDYIDFSAKIILTGISMGASTVLLAASNDSLPQNVIGVIADCGYTSAEAIISRVISKLNLSPKLIMPFVKIGTKYLGKFDLSEASAIDAVENCKVPVIFFHGDNDNFIPCEMSAENYEACGSEIKKLVIIEGAGHGLCYVINPSKYIMEVKKFFESVAKDEDFDTESENS